MLLKLIKLRFNNGGAGKSSLSKTGYREMSDREFFNRVDNDEVTEPLTTA